ncbi:hypothetical protein [Herbaspirillum sp. SJZ099]|uniref:hypothetical protein n=1 Tax=Herbaspirillum sp. SJZ099 TaxID=2572916 RepID=UPI0011A5C21D|nr:hypothetical protein [Herbaspirillum sp. SJZ099]
MDFLNFKNSLDEYRFSFGFGEKAKSAAKIAGVAAANTIILTGKVVTGIAGRKDRTEQRFKNRQK